MAQCRERQAPFQTKSGLPGDARFGGLLQALELLGLKWGLRNRIRRENRTAKAHCVNTTVSGSLQCRLAATSLGLRLLGRRRRYSHCLAQVLELDLAAVEGQIALEDYVEGGAAGEFRLGAAG